jgi:hypothetical protein
MSCSDTYEQGKLRYWYVMLQLAGKGFGIADAITEFCLLISSIHDVGS